MVAEAQGENGFQIYDPKTRDHSVRSVGHLGGGAIQGSAFVTDMDAFMSLMAE